MCKCPDGMGGDPTSITGCHGYECRIDDDCSNDQSCMGFRCKDPCPGSCGVGAYCKVEKHHPVCFCNRGLTGNPLTRCYVLQDPIQNNPCIPTPCGLNTHCQILNNRAVCSCLPDYLGDPQSGCNPECTINSDCPATRSCINRKCENPCAGTVCGVNAECRVSDHTASCECPRGYTGDPFFQCIPVPIREHDPTSHPCQPSPCVAQQVCAVYGNVAICDPCSAPDAFSNPQCRPECLSNSDCSFDKACLGQKCLDPCPGSCGHNAICTVRSHNPMCTCPQGLVGNPFQQCVVPATISDQPETCNTIRCGSNAECLQEGGVLACVCKREYYGDPLVGCRPECVINPDCAANMACVNNKCINPCPNACGLEALCETVNHYPVCYCPPDHTGDALVQCSPYRRPIPPIADRPGNPCDPSPCGLNSRCLVSNEGYAACSCLPNYRGSPPLCQPECVSSSECQLNKACINLKCTDPCPGTCGIAARCEVINHNPICSCLPGHQGDPFISCEFLQDKGIEPSIENPCSPSPCGPNSLCHVKQDRPVCSCVANYVGHPPYCRPECVVSSECSQDKACINEKCKNPCTNVCGTNAQCHVVAHSAYCNCLTGYQGDAFIGCSRIPEQDVEKSHDPCYPSPCGENAQCTERNGAARCACIPPYLGDPYSIGCRPECVLNSECPSNHACIKQHCRDPCPGVCGSNAECAVVNHIPVCSCEKGYRGDPFSNCRREQSMFYLLIKFNFNY